MMIDSRLICFMNPKNHPDNRQESVLLLDNHPTLERKNQQHPTSALLCRMDGWSVDRKHFFILFLSNNSSPSTCIHLPSGHWVCYPLVLVHPQLRFPMDGWCTGGQVFVPFNFVIYPNYQSSTKRFNHIWLWIIIYESKILIINPISYFWLHVGIKVFCFQFCDLVTLYRSSSTRGISQIWLQLSLA
jgi:hypothetical protein